MHVEQSRSRPTCLNFSCPRSKRMPKQNGLRVSWKLLPNNKPICLNWLYGSKLRGEFSKTNVYIDTFIVGSFSQYYSLRIAYKGNHMYKHDKQFLFTPAFVMTRIYVVLDYIL